LGKSFWGDSFCGGKNKQLKGKKGRFDKIKANFIPASTRDKLTTTKTKRKTE
jgi:hypothetical protein